ncbi:hypothetical protein AMJ82_07835, partial [candidate division TA06 bacterium SM23_40]
YDSVHWENSDRAGWTEHSRRLDFFGLPSRCTIRIYTLDGDLVDTVDHPSGEAMATASSEPWNLISRDIQAIVSGVYLFSVEYDNGDVQVGKFVVIK